VILGGLPGKRVPFRRRETRRRMSILEVLDASGWGSRMPNTFSSCHSRRSSRSRSISKLVECSSVHAGQSFFESARMAFGMLVS